MRPVSSRGERGIRCRHHPRQRVDDRGVVLQIANAHSRQQLAADPLGHGAAIRAVIVRFERRQPGHESRDVGGREAPDQPQPFDQRQSPLKLRLHEQTALRVSDGADPGGAAHRETIDPRVAHAEAFQREEQQAGPAEAAQGDDGLGQLLVGHGGKHALRKRNGVGAIEAMLTNRCEYARDQERGVGDGAGLDANAVVDFFAFEHRFPEIPRARAGQRPIWSGANLLQKQAGVERGTHQRRRVGWPEILGGFDKRSIQRTQIVTPACARGLSPAADIAQRRGRQLPERIVEPGQLAAIGIEQRFHEAMRRIRRFPDQRFPDCGQLRPRRVSRRDARRLRCSS